MPASELLLALFVANCVAGDVFQAQTVDKWLAGIHRGHQIADAPWFGGHLLSQAKKGAIRPTPSTSHDKNVAELPLGHLTRRHLDLSNSFDAAFFCHSMCCILGLLPSW